MYNTPDDHVTRDIREGIAKLGDLRFRVLDSAGLEAEASSGSILHRTASMTANVLARSNFALFLTDARFVSSFLLYAYTMLPLRCLGVSQTDSLLCWHLVVIFPQFEWDE